MPSSTDFLLPEIFTLQPVIPNSVSASPQLKTSEGRGEHGDQAEQDIAEEGVRGGAEELAQGARWWGVIPEGWLLWVRAGKGCRDLLFLG